MTNVTNFIFSIFGEKLKKKLASCMVFFFRRDSRITKKKYTIHDKNVTKRVFFFVSSINSGLKSDIA